MSKKLLNKKVLLTGCMLVGITSVPVLTANAADVTLDITTTVNSTLNIAKGATINFGEIDPNPIGDTITLDASGGAVTAATTLNGSGVKTASSGTIDLTSSSDLQVELTFDSNSVNLTESATSKVLVAQNFAVNSEGQSGVPFAHSAGTSSINVGGELVIPIATDTNIVQGATYNGTIGITLVYN